MGCFSRNARIHGDISALSTKPSVQEPLNGLGCPRGGGDPAQQHKLMCFVPEMQIWTSVTSPQSPATSSARTPRAATSAPAPGATSCRRMARSAKVQEQGAGGQGTGQPDVGKCQQEDVGKGATHEGLTLPRSRCGSSGPKKAPGSVLEAPQHILSSRELRGMSPARGIVTRQAGAVPTLPG